MKQSHESYITWPFSQMKMNLPRKLTTQNFSLNYFPFRLRVGPHETKHVRIPLTAMIWRHAIIASSIHLKTLYAVTRSHFMRLRKHVANLDSGVAEEFIFPKIEETNGTIQDVDLPVAGLCEDIT